MKRRESRSLAPLDCVVLAVDTAQVSGWCIMVRGLFVAASQGDLLRFPHMPETACITALELGRCNALPVVLVYERPFRGNTQGQYIGAWKTAWSAAGGVKSRTVGVYPPTWRARVLGPGWARAERDAARRFEAQVAQHLSARTCDPDEAAAVCIAKWGAHAGEVLKKLPASARKGAA